jgi:ribosomal protein S18 acetylase RimI-like enzyme
MEIRTMRPADYDYIIRRVDEWWGGRNMMPGLPRLFVNHFAGTSLVTEDSRGRIAGFVVGFISPRIEDEAYIHYTAVDPAYRGKGAARAMYLEFFDQARENGCVRVSCFTSPINSQSIAFHQRMGFCLLDSATVEDGVPVHKDYNGPGRHAVLFQRELD